MAWFGTHGYRKKITIDNTKVAGNETDFTVPYYVTDTDIRDNIGQADGGDILFTSSDGETQLSHELVEYDAGTGLVEAYVKIPSLSSSSDTEIYIYYGDAAIANQSTPDAAWDSNYVIVNHGRLDSIGTWNSKTSPQADSFNNLTQVDNEGAGQIGNAIYSADADSDDYVRVLDSAETQLSPESTWEWILKPSAFSGYNDGPGGKSNTNTDNPFVGPSGILPVIASAGHWEVVGMDGGYAFTDTGSSVGIDGQWHYCVGMLEAGLVTAATDDQSDVDTAVMSNGGSVAAIGADVLLQQTQQRPGIGTSLFDGATSEFRVSGTARSLTWRQTTFESTINYATFTATSAEESVPVDPGDTWYPHHPFPVPIGDRCKNTRYTTGGDIWFNVVDDFDQDTSWDVINCTEQDTSWDIINCTEKDTSWDIINDHNQDTSWDIINCTDQDTSWDIVGSTDQDTSWDIQNEWTQNTSWDIIKDFAQDISWQIWRTIYPYIQEFVIKFAKTNFDLPVLNRNISVKPIIHNYGVSNVIEDDFSVIGNPEGQSFKLKTTVFNFSIKNPLISNITIFRVSNYTGEV